MEFALISPIFFAIIFGGIEMTLMFQSNLAIQDVSRSAARVASIARDDANADQLILQEIDARSGTVNGDIAMVIIYAADTLDSPVPSQCFNASGIAQTSPGNCNAYNAEWVDVAAGSAPVVTPGTGITDAQRKQWQNIGIYIEYDYTFVTGFIDTTTLSATTVEVIELDL
ncbi:MAG: pilus assembly protein [Acidimicrobiales bacterium]|nr:pilus assembly protein [Acidimicrobiales bacterium]